MKHLLKLSLFAVVLASPLMMAEEEVKTPQTVDTSVEVSTSADNTTRNVRERSEAEKTPVDQNENKADLAITQKIRKSIVDDKSLSTYAHNVKIITQNGTVNLKGPVRSVVEKARVEKAALEVAGNGKVESQLEVAPSKNK